MARMIFKLHPRCLAWFVDMKNFGVVEIGTSIIANGEKIEGLMQMALPEVYKDKEEAAAYAERPYVKLAGDHRKAIAEIETIQRTYGVLAWIVGEAIGELHEINPSSFGERPSHDKLLSEVRVKLNTRENGLKPIQELCLADCLWIAQELENERPAQSSS